MAARARLFKERNPELLCYEQYVYFAIQEIGFKILSINRSGILEEYSPEYLGKMFEYGYRINV
jgi:hypothetical protein